MNRRIFALIAAAGLLGCTPASSASVQSGRATLRPVCGPTDGPAVLLEVSDTARESPRFRLRVSGSVGELGGREVVVRENDDDAYVDWCDGDECHPPRNATATTVRFGPLRSDSSAAVRVRTTGPDGKPFAWSGVARWHGERPICG
jgi:hypothetical protein